MPGFGVQQAPDGARTLGLVRFMSVEPHDQQSWSSDIEETVVGEHGLLYIKREIPWRSIRNCMEALLKALLRAVLLIRGAQCGFSVGAEDGNVLRSDGRAVDAVCKGGIDLSG